MRSKIGGFTLLELLFVMTILGIVAGTTALSTPRILARWRLHSAARQVVLDLQTTRLLAVTQGATRRIRFPEHEGHYFFQRRRGREFVDDGPPRELPNGVNIEGCTARRSAISFRPRGHAGTFGTVTLGNESGDSVRVVVDMVGRMRIG